MTATNPLGSNFTITMSNVKENNLTYMEEFLNKTKEVIGSGSYILGRKVEEFENKFCQYLGMPYCVAVSSGTSALELVFSILNLSEKDEIVIQANAYIACAFGTLKSKAKLKIIDCELDGTFSISKLRGAITENTKAVLVVHLYGDCCNMDLLTEVCNENNLFLIEDCAQSLGSEYNSRKLGSFGDFSCHSFYPTKNLGAIGDAGAIVLNNELYARTLKKYRNLGSTEKYKHDLKGTNSRMDALQSVFLLAKINDLDNQIDIKRRIAKYYSGHLTHLYNKDANVKHSYHLFVILVDNRDEVMKFLSNNGIETLIHYPIPFYKSGAFQEYNLLSFRNAEYLSSTMLSIPIHTSLSNEQQMQIVQLVKSV